MADFLNLSVLVHAGLKVGFFVLVVVYVGFLINYVWCIGCLLAFFANFLDSSFLLTAKVFISSSSHASSYDL